MSGDARQRPAGSVRTADDPEPWRGLTRRHILQGTGALLLAGCGGSGAKPRDAGDGGGFDAGVDGADGGDTSPPLSMFRAWSEMRDAFRQSPDHLAAAADRVVATGDAERIFLFVRDNFATIPASTTSLGSASVRAMGIRGTLRAGAGTLRDKAELLVDLYTRAGFAAAVYEGTPAATTDFVKTVLERNISLPFAPPITDAQLAQWQTWLGVTTAPTRAPAPDPGGTNGAALATTLGSLLPTPLTMAEAFSLTPPTTIPIVRVTVAGANKYANVALPTAAFGDSGVTGTPTASSAPSAFPTVQVTLSIVTTVDPLKPVDVVTASWPVSDVVGRSLFVGMMPPENLTTLLLRKLEDVRTFLPVLAVRGPGMTDAEQQALTKAGAAITLAGDKIDLTGDTITIRGAPIDTTPLDPTRVARVTALQMSIDASRFPEIRVRASAVDAGGATVPGLPASAFTVDEESAPEVFTLLENRAPPPRVLFLLDKSDSVPAAFAGANGAALVRSIATQMLADEPACMFRVLPVGGDKMMGTWTSDPAALETAATTQMGFGSDLWAALADASTLAATVIIMITDGVTLDMSTPKILAALSLAPPTVFVGTGAGPFPTLDSLAAVVESTVVAATTPADASTGALAFVRARQHGDYLFRYEAPADGAMSRHVALGLASSAVTAAGVYTVPAPAQRNPPARIGGILLTVKVGSEAAFVRVLAGAREIPAAAPDSLFDEVRGALFGCTEVRFERAPPTQAAVLDDILTTQLDREPLARAAIAQDWAAFLDAYLKQPPPYSLATVALHQRLPGTGGRLTFASGLRAVALTSALRFGSAGGVHQRVDLFPIGPYRTADSDAAAAFATTLSRTAWLASVEDAMAAKTTRKLLDGQALALAKPFTGFDTALPSAPAATVAAFDLAGRDLTGGYRLPPASGSPVAFWHVDAKSGALLGVLDNGAGGGSGDFECTVDIALKFFEILGDLASLLGLMGTLGGVWLQLEITKARKLLGATILIGGGMPSSATGDPTDLSDLPKTVICGLGNAALGAGAAAAATRPGILGVAGMAWTAASNADTAIDLAGGPSVFSVCPGPSGGGTCH